MVVNLNKSRIVCLSHDPKTIFSYGLQVKELITGLKMKKKEDWPLFLLKFLS